MRTTVEDLNKKYNDPPPLKERIQEKDYFNKKQKGHGAPLNTIQIMQILKGKQL